MTNGEEKDKERRRYSATYRRREGKTTKRSKIKRLTHNKVHTYRETGERERESVCVCV